MNPRSEPLLWVQLISLGAVPLELLLLVLVLAGSDPGPLPQLERVLAWALGALAPALLLWRQGADPRSLLLITAAVPLEPGLAARLRQQQGSLLPKVLFGAGVVALLPLVGWMDTHAALAGNFSPLQDGARLSALLLCVVLLALMVWQWHQLVQAGWLLWAAGGPEGGGTPDSATRPHLDPNNPGLPLLLLSPLVFPQPAADRTAVHAAAEDQPAAACTAVRSAAGCGNTHRPRRRPRQGVRASCSRRARSSGSKAFESFVTRAFEPVAEW